LAVSDTGHGMDERTRAHAFEPFFTTKEHGKGTGLGLATVYGIIAQSGGSISLSSAPERGATFTILLPEATLVAAAASQPELTSDQPLRGAETILLVEDDSAVRELVRQV